MWVERGVLQCRVVRATDEEFGWLSDYLCFKDPKAHHKGRSTDKVRMFNRVTDMFPSGFYSMVAKAARTEGYEFETIDKRVLPATPDGGCDLDWLRDYQYDALKAAVEAQTGILWLPTGAGKTEIVIALPRILPCRWLFLAHRTGLTEQAADRYDKRNAEHGLYLPPAGRIGEGHWSVDDRFTCASFATIGEGLRKGNEHVQRLLAEADAIAIDECHVVPADTHYAIAMTTPNAVYRFGLSGTPLARGDQKSMLALAALGPVVYRLKSDVLIDAGVLAKPHIHMVEVEHESERVTWQGVYGECIVRSTQRNKVVVECARRAPKPAFLFVKEVNHGKALTRMLERAGMRAHFVWGQQGVEFRKRIVKDLVANRLDVVVCSVVFQEGIDVPELRSVVVASGGKSVIAALQRIGRGMRSAAGKTTFDVYDIADKGCGCREAARAMGTPDVGVHGGCKWLERHTKARRRAYLVEGHTTTMEQWTAPD